MNLLHDVPNGDLPPPQSEASTRSCSATPVDCALQRCESDIEPVTFFLRQGSFAPNPDGRVVCVLGEQQRPGSHCRVPQSFGAADEMEAHLDLVEQKSDLQYAGVETGSVQCPVPEALRPSCFIHSQKPGVESRSSLPSEPIRREVVVKPV